MTVIKFVAPESNRSIAIESEERRFPRHLHLGKIEINGKTINGFDLEETLNHIDPTATLYAVNIDSMTTRVWGKGFAYDLTMVEKETIKYWVSLFDSKDYYERELSPEYIARYAQDLNVTSEALIEWANN